jgi:hypothetical protein
MGKKRRMIARPQKYGAKYAKHPALSGASEEEAPAVQPKVDPVVETPVLKLAEEAIEKPKAAKKKAPAKKVSKPRKTTSKK